MSSICSACLSQDRTLVPFDMAKFESIFGDNKIVMKVVSVCWECTAVFRKLYDFKLQVLHAQESLNSYVDKVTLQPLSKLKSCTTITHDICCIKNINATSPISKPNIYSEVSIKTDENNLKDVNNMKMEEDSQINDDDKLFNVKIENDDNSESETTIEINKMNVEEEINKKTNADKASTTKQNDTTKTKTESEANRGIEKQSKKNRVKCQVCSAEFENKIKFDQHMKTKHSEPEAYCAECDLRFATYSVYKRHLKYTAKHRPDTQETKEKKRKRNQEYQRAWRQRQKDLKKKVSKEEKDENKRKRHCENQRAYYHRMKSLKENDKNVEELSQKKLDDLQMHPCSECDAKFVNATALKKHKKSKHLNEPRPVKCDRCEKRFVNQVRLRVHTRQEHAGV